jgi:hypothetical protein
MTTDDPIVAGFVTACSEAEVPQRWYVSLYIRRPFYGGPEEGGWWGDDFDLVMAQPYLSREEACAAATKAREYAETLTKQEEKKWTRQCSTEILFAEARGMEPSDIFPETDGHASYEVIVEDKLGDHAYKGDRFYS